MIIAAEAKLMTRMLCVATASERASKAHMIVSVPFRTINPPRAQVRVILLDADQRPSLPPSLPSFLSLIAEAEQRCIS